MEKPGDPYPLEISSAPPLKAYLKSDLPAPIRVGATAPAEVELTEGAAEFLAHWGF